MRVLDQVERLARWLLPSADEMTEGELIFFSVLALMCAWLVLLFYR